MADKIEIAATTVSSGKISFVQEVLNRGKGSTSDDAAKAGLSVRTLQRWIKAGLV